jgi:lysophospholipase L1-like esterase
MRKGAIGVLLLILFGAAHPAAAAGRSYYLALGDSVAVGAQPSSSGTLQPTNRGYADDLYAVARTKYPALKLAKLGCIGETTATMISGGICAYSQGSQLAEAVAFLATHQVAFVTIDLGANDLFPCGRLSPVPSLDPVCLEAATTSVAQNLVTIIGTLRASAPTVPIVAMNYYDPFLALWALVPGGESLAAQSLTVIVQFNNLLEAIYAGFGVPVADVEAAFHSGDFTVIQPADLPLNVLIALTWTYMGALPPKGPDVHPNAIGYAAIAGAFAQVLSAGGA